MKTFKQFIAEKNAYPPGTVLSFGATAYGNADIDNVTAREIKDGVLKPEWQFMGNRGNRITPGYSVANNTLLHGTIVRITNSRTGEPIGAKFGNTQGIYKVEDTGGSQVKRNIDFYSGSNREMFNYYASLGKNTNNLRVEVLNIRPGSPEEKQIIANLKSGKDSSNIVNNTSNTPQDTAVSSDTTYNTVSDALGGLKQGANLLAMGMGGGIK